ncbi:MAG: cytochrome c oxidase accessory protein CcoG [Gammaproteobacteria bacterium]|nr:cytochrome c oxidase accessory protein CcoG [Gammaproteobacteria bacterium]
MKADTAPAPADSYYQAHRKIYPREIHGRYARLRALAVWVLLGLYYLLPWLDLHGRQAVLFDLAERKFYIFGLVMWPQDFIFLTWLLVLAALSLFFFTALAGRLWCAYACPQTVWTEAFLWLERLAEGSRQARIRLDAAPWGPRKFLRKASKQLLWVGFAAWTGFTFVGFFTPIRALAADARALALSPWELFWILFYGFATYGNAGYLREQVCKYMCPYARFQSAMFDQDTMIITYDASRGEPRGSRRREAPRGAGGLGDCIDCTWCVQVCPTGIDIRKGLQIECIACAACIDACDSVMDRIGYPRGLVRYTTQHALDHGTTHVLRPRVLIYGAILAILAGGFGLALALRTPLGLDVIRDRTSLFRTLDDGRIENVYTLKILNKSEQARKFAVTVSGPGKLTLDPAQPVVSVASEEVYPVVVRVQREAYEPNGSETIQFHIAARDDPRVTASHAARLLAPTR